MKKALFILLVPAMISAHTISELFDALKEHSQTKSDEMLVQQAKLGQDLAYASLYPKLDLFAKYDNYSLPTGMIPLAPNNMLALVQNTSHPAQPFSYNIYSEGLHVSMPLFVKSIFTMADSAKMTQKSVQEKKRLNLIKNEALIIGSDAELVYLSSLREALLAQKQSLLESKKIVEIKVQNGRESEAPLYMINDRLNQIEIALNNAEIAKKSAQSIIETLSGILVEEPIVIQKIADVTPNDFESLSPVRANLSAQQLQLKAKKEQLYPSLYAHGNYVFSQGDAYNKSENMHEEYGNVGVVLNVPLFDMNTNDAVSLEQLKLRTSQIQLQKLHDELASESKLLQDSLKLQENSMKMYEKSVEEKKKLLVIAKLKFELGRISTEEYLRYEDDVSAQEANLYRTKAKWWQTLMQQAVIYANNIEEIVQ